jgi:tetratricopeptide (TPR) repeat protein
VAIGYYKKGLKLKFEERQYEQATEYFQRAGGVYEKIITNNLEKEQDAGYLYYYLAGTHQQLKQWEQAIQNFQYVVDNYPNFEYVCGAQAGVGWCYEAMLKEGKISKEQAEPIIEQVYTEVLSKYPGCYITDYVTYQLAGISEDKGDTIAAGQYYKMFLEIAHPKDSRVEIAKAKLAKLEGID